MGEGWPLPPLWRKMREEIYTDRPRTRFELLRLSGSGTTVTVKQGKSDASYSLASSAFTIRNKFPFRSAPFVFTSVGSSIAGGYATSSSVGASSQIVTTRAAGGSAGDGLVNILEVGWDTNLQNAATSAGLPIVTNLAVDLEAFHIKGTGTAAIVQGKTRGTLVDNGTGDYTLTLKTALQSDESVVFGQAIGATCAVANVDVTNRTTLAIKTYNASGSAADADCYVFVFRSLTRGHFGKSRRVLQACQTGAKARFFRIDVSGGTPSLVYKPKGATITDNGTGDFTVTLPGRSKSKRNPLVLLGGGVKNTVVAVTGTTVQVGCFDAGGSAADPAVPVYGMIIGFDHTSEAW
jgi:hypothetical protein